MSTKHPRRSNSRAYKSEAMQFLADQRTCYAWWHRRQRGQLELVENELELELDKDPHRLEILREVRRDICVELERIKALVKLFSERRDALKADKISAEAVLDWGAGLSISERFTFREDDRGR